MYLSNRHKEVEAEFSKLDDAERTPKVYMAMCRAAKIRESAIENRLSALQLFAKKNPFKKKTDKKGKPAGKQSGDDDEVDEDDNSEEAARKRNDQRRRAWQDEYTDPDDKDEPLVDQDKD